jgi:60 kDa SS-A/Ro ribonucleoprotein
MLWALKHEVGADGLVIPTDSETYAGAIHPSQALRRYRQETGIPARLIVVGTVSDRFTIADPDDGGMLEVVGMDTATPDLMASFARGEP